MAFELDDLAASQTQRHYAFPPRHITLGQNLICARARARVTIRELSAASGVGQRTINEFERDISNPRPQTLWKLSQALGIEIEDLICGTRPIPHRNRPPPSHRR